jgi:hypothetical protein
MNHQEETSSVVSCIGILRASNGVSDAVIRQKRRLNVTALPELEMTRCVTVANKKGATRVPFLCGNSPEGLLLPVKFIAELFVITSR